MADDPIKQLEDLKKAGLEIAKEMKSADEKARKAAEGMRLFFEELTTDPAKMEKARQDIALWAQHMREAGDAARTLERGTDRLIRTLTGVEESADGAAAGFARIVDEADTMSEGLSKALKTIQGRVKEVITPTNVAISVFKKFAEGTSILTLSVDNATTAFAKATGTGAKYKDVIEAAEYRNRHLGVSATDASAATAALHGGFTEFLMMSTDAQKTLVANIAAFETFGVAAGTTTKFLEAVTRTTGRSRNEALQLQNSIMGTAHAFGDDLNKVMEETSTIMPKLAIHGKNLNTVLDNLYATSKRTGIAMSDIVSLAEQFDTFESAAGAAANLNAVLGQMGGGTLIDTMQILEETDPAKRMQLFSDAIQQSVGNYEELGYYQQKAVANAMGMTVEQTRQLMLQEEQTSALDAALAKRGLGEDEVLALQKEGRDIATEMKILMMEFAVSMKGPINGLKTMIHWLSTAVKWLGDIGKGFEDIPVIGKLMSGGFKLGGVLASTAGILMLMKRTALRGTRWSPMFVKFAGGVKGLFSKGLRGLIPGTGAYRSRMLARGAAQRAAGSGFLPSHSLLHPSMSKTGGFRGGGLGGTAARATGFGKFAAGTAGKFGMAAGLGIGALNIARADAEERKAKAVKGMVGALVGGGLGFLLGGPAGAAFGATTGFGVGTGLANGGIVNKPMITPIGENAPQEKELVTPLSEAGVKVARQDEMIAEQKKDRVVLGEIRDGIAQLAKRPVTFGKSKLQDAIRDATRSETVFDAA